MNDKAQMSNELKTKYRILIVDDHPMMRAGLAAKIADEPDLEVYGEAEDTAEALAMIESDTPDMAIIDIALKEGHGIDLVEAVHSCFPSVKMLVLSAYQEPLYGERALRAGALGYLTKQETGEKIFDAIRTVLAAERYVSPELTQRLVAQAIGASESTKATTVETLSNRELEIFRLIGEGLTTAAIASHLRISPHTVNTHREKIKQKLNLGTANALQREATQWMLENG